MLHLVRPGALRIIAPVAIYLYGLFIILEASYLPRVSCLLGVSNVHCCSVPAPTYAYLWLALEVIVIICAIRFLFDHFD